MSDLISVEYAPSDAPDRPELEGMLGETYRSAFEGKGNPFTEEVTRTVPVRFPLLLPQGRLVHGSVPGPEISLGIEGIMLPIKDLCVVKSVPISYYDKIRFTNDTPIDKVKALFESDYCLDIQTSSKLTKIIKMLEQEYEVSSIWNTAKTVSSLHSEAKFVFTGARAYGIHTLVTTYNSRKFGGVVLSIGLRGVRRGEVKPRKCIFSQMFPTNILLSFSNTKEYIDDYDGEEMKYKPKHQNNILSWWDTTFGARLLKASDVRRAKKKEQK
jgi:hypothetical protein